MEHVSRRVKLLVIDMFSVSFLGVLLLLCFFIFKEFILSAIYSKVKQRKLSA